ncbi:MAG TPA: hypothetical protein VFO39_09800 [Candidatus Sulfotelmatobacter sp.]|nr:hypothetical protein [Candidatus Sulfotelmatobacter sp.]
MITSGAAVLCRAVQLLLLTSWLTVGLHAADNPFVGDWKLNPAKSKLTDEMKVTSVEKNKYAFDFGGGKPETIVVDGTDQPGGFGTTLSVSREGPNSWKVIRKKDGHVLVRANWTLSQDQNTLKDEFTLIRANGSPSTVNYIYTRRHTGSGFAGDWVSTSETVTSVFVLKIRPYEADGLSIIDPSGLVTKNVNFDGKDYPTKSPIAGSTSSARRLNELTLEITDNVNGKASRTDEIQLSSDRKTLTRTFRVEGNSEPTIMVFERQ